MPEPRRDTRARKLKYITIIALFALWALLTETGLISSPYTASPHEVILAFRSFFGTELDPTINMLLSRGTYFEQVLVTAMRMYTSLAIGASAGILLGLVAGRSVRFHEAYRWVLVAAGTVPPVAIVLYLAVGVYPFGALLNSKGVIVAASTTSYLCVGSAAFGIGRDKQYEEYLEAARLDGASWMQAYALIILPIAKLNLVAALRTALWGTYAMTYFAELRLASTGMGRFLSTMAEITRMPEFFAVLLTGYLLTIPGFLVLSYWERRTS